VDFTTRDADKYLWYGWSIPEPESRWTSGSHATVVFSLSEIKPVSLSIKMAPFVVQQKLETQPVTLRLNGQIVARLTLQNPMLSNYSFSLAVNALRDRNVLEFDIPEATAPAELVAGVDERQLG